MSSSKPNRRIYYYHTCRIVNDSINSLLEVSAVFVLLFSLTLVNISMANATIVHDEFVDGDLTGFRGTSTTSLGTLNPGIHTIIGNLSGGVAGNSSDGTDEFDVFFFTTSESWTIDAVSISGVRVLALLYDDIVAPFDPSIASHSVSSTTLDFFGERAAGDWGITFLPGSNSGETAYEFNINVSQVPVPAGIWFFTTALLSVMTFCRRKKFKN